jgi:hypothetical protein
LLPTWEGNDQPSGGRVVATDYRLDGNHSRPATDYDLACSHADARLSLIEVGNKYGSCLETWIPCQRGFHSNSGRDSTF